MQADTIPADVRERIVGDLAAIERTHGVRILMAVESGSRAWGFPSPDSDYDIRFIYVRPLDWYLSIDRRRDVIEMPIADRLDYSGWDLKKALQLLAKPNPALLEWLSSPILYRRDVDIVAELRLLADATRYRPVAWHHYRNLLIRHYSRSFDGRGKIGLKNYFYALRPATALVWLAQNETGVVSSSSVRIL